MDMSQAPVDTNLRLNASKGVALITGCAARGIGRAIALRLASDGFDVALNDLPTPTQLTQLAELETTIRATYPERRVVVVPGDVSNEEAVVGMVNKTLEVLGGLNVMVANAGMCRVQSVLDTTVEIFDKIIQVNLRGVFLCYREAARVMLGLGVKGGRIIGASSLTGKRGLPNVGVYSASKAGIRGLTQSFAEELAPHGITVNAYAPGVIDTDLVQTANNELNSIGQADFFDYANTAAPVRHAGKPEDIAAFVSYVASGESGYMTGQTVSVNGGLFYD